MTTEDDFHAMLDAHPDDAHCRLVFADWLDEHGDPRAEGYRALGVCRVSSWKNGRQWLWWDVARNVPDETFVMDFRSHGAGAGELPTDWFNALGERTYGLNCRDYETRREAEGAAALAFAQLPAERRAELLNPVAV